MVRRYWLTAGAFFAIVCAITALRPAPTPGPLARDFEAYWSAGTTSNDGANPYGRTIWSAERNIAGVDAHRDELLPFISPPHTLIVWRAAAWLPYRSATYCWWALIGVALLALVAGVVRGAGAAVTPLIMLTASLLAFAYAPISSDLALGQAALPAFAGAVVVVVFAERSFWVAIPAAIVAFAQPNAALGLIGRIGRNRATLAVALGAALTYALGSLMAGWDWPLTYARAVGEHATAERFSAIQFGPAAIAFDFGATPAVATAVALAIALLAVAAAFGIIRSVPDAFARFAGLSALVPFVAGFFHEHDFVVAFGAALWSALRTTGATRAVAFAGTLLVGFDWLGLAQRRNAVAQSVLLELALVAAFLALGERTELRRAMPIVAGVAAVIAGAAVLAVHNPVPVWPDLLAGFHAPAIAGIATIWMTEQRANGLLAAVPAWGALRSLSLLGCALLAYAIYRHPLYCRTR